MPIIDNSVDRDRCSRWATLAVFAEAVLRSVDRQRIHHGWQNKRRGDRHPRTESSSILG